MLILGRREQESLTFTHMGESFTVEVSRISGSRVTLAIDAPESVDVKRTELLEEPCEAK